MSPTIIPKIKKNPAIGHLTLGSVTSHRYRSDVTALKIIHAIIRLIKMLCGNVFKIEEKSVSSLSP
jgi:hypothetical protein